MDPQANPYAPPTANVDQSAPTEADDYVLATRGARFLGAFLDNLFMALLMLPMVFVGDSLGDSLGFASMGPDQGIVALLTAFLIPLVIYCGIQWTLIATTGQSVGKKLVGTKIVRLDGSPCGIVHGVILRSWITGGLALLPTIGTIFGFVDALIIFGEEQRCGHDLIAGTRVIAAPIQG